MEEDQDHNHSHVCKFCNKSFRNAKCLGSHMRNHRQDAGPSKIGYISGDHSSKIENENPKRESPTKVNQCKGCGKEFSSIKALFGHMRCHPDLIKKKSRTKRFKSTSISLGSQFESVLHYQNDSVTEPETEEAAMVLLMLSKGAPLLGQNDGVKESFAGDNLSMKRYNNNTNENWVVRIDELEKPESETGLKDHKSDQISSKGRSKPCLEKKLKSTCDENSANKKGEYVCKTCYMIFTSHQALGGHCSQHHNASRPSSSLFEIKLEDITMSTENEANQKRKTHDCSICLKIYESGCALGGHMRTHYGTRYLQC